jgi:hypothetical protein
VTAKSSFAKVSKDWREVSSEACLSSPDETEDDLDSEREQNLGTVAAYFSGFDLTR